MVEAARPETVVVVPVPVDVTAPGLRVSVQVPLAGKPDRSMLPVARAHVGCVMVPIMGAAGVAGWALMATLPEATDVQPPALVTVNVYVTAAASPETVVVVPVPVEVIAPGLRVSVQVPVAGNPERSTLPVATEQVGWVMVPIIGAVGTAGCALITTFPDATEVQPAALVTVKVYVADAVRPVMVAVVPVPVVVTAPGLRVSVQVPAPGNPDRATLPVVTEQVGWVMVPMVGAAGGEGRELITTLAEAKEVQAASLVTVKV